MVIIKGTIIGILVGLALIMLSTRGLTVRYAHAPYDLWGDIFDNIPRFGKAYRKFLIRKFG